MTNKASMSEYTGPTSCGVWCFGLSCGCASCELCVSPDDGEIPAAGRSHEYTVGENACYLADIAHERSNSIVYTSGEDILNDADVPASSLGDESGKA